MSPEQKDAQNEKRLREDREKQHHLSPEQNDAQNKKEKLRMKRRWEEESTEATAARNKKEKLSMKRRRDKESTEATAARNEKKKSSMKRLHDEESTEATAAQNEKEKFRKKRRREEESTEATAARKTKDKQSKKRKHQCQHQTTGNNVYNDNETKISNECLMKEAKHILHRTKDPDNPFRFRAIVCIICDRFIIGTEKINTLTPDQISQHSHRLSVKTYESSYGHELKLELRKQYQMNCNGLKDLLLSHRSRKYWGRGYATCAGCALGMRSNLTTKKTPPKFAIANGFVIGSFPPEIEFINKEGETVIRKIKDNELTDLLKAMMAPVRTYGYVFAYSEGSQKSIKGNFHFFEMDQNRLGAVMTHLNQAGIGEHIYVVLCGRMTPEQKQIVRMRAVINTQLFIDILTWFVTKSGHKGYENTTIPEKCLQPVFIEDQETNNNTDKSIDVQNLATKVTRTLPYQKNVFNQFLLKIKKQITTQINQLMLIWKQILKVIHIIFRLHKNHQKTHRYLAVRISLLLHCFGIQHPHC